jgi:DNA-binding NarL/FixJ family response regulator
VTLAVASRTIQRSSSAVAIYSADRALRDRLERLLGADASLAVVGVAGDLPALTRLIEDNRVDVALVDSRPAEPLIPSLILWLRRHRATAFVAIVEGPRDGALAALRAGVCAFLARTADDADIAATVKAAGRGLAVMPRDLLEAMQPVPPSVDGLPRTGGAGETLLTSREIEVLAAVADGASNKAIARRLGISFHTVKFHVAGILAKLDADSRTEAVTKAAQLGLVML